MFLAEESRKLGINNTSIFYNDPKDKYGWFTGAILAVIGLLVLAFLACLIISYTKHQPVKYKNEKLAARSKRFN